MPNVSKQSQQGSRIRLPPISKILENIKDFAQQYPWCVRSEYYDSNVPYPCGRGLMHDLTVYHLNSGKTFVNDGTRTPIGTVVHTVPCNNDVYRSYTSETEDDNRRVSESSIDMLTTVAIQRLAEERESSIASTATTTADELVDVEPSNTKWPTVVTKSKADTSEPCTPLINHVSKPKASVTTTQQRKCQQCGKTSTPEWRRGPVGPRTLCNACGLFYCKLVKKVGERIAREKLLTRSRVG